MRKRGTSLIWPLYLDASLSRKKGRRVSKELSVRNPSTNEIASAASELGWVVATEPRAAHPSQPWNRTGVVSVKGNAKKAAFLSQLAKRVLQKRSEGRSD